MQDHDPRPPQKEPPENGDNKLSRFMSLGMSIGTCVGAALMPFFGHMAVAYGLMGGLLIGTIIGAAAEGQK